MARKQQAGVSTRSFDFNALVGAIRLVHEQSSTRAGKAVNISLTIRNWAIGCYIYEFEQDGADRAEYGEALLQRLAERLQEEGMERADARELRRYRQFFRTYPRIRGSLSPEFKQLLPAIVQLSASGIREAVSPEWQVSGDRLVTSLSFSHLNELMTIEDSFKRAFYEVECIRGNWSVRELQRQIGSLYYERSGLSNDKEALAAAVASKAENAEPRLAVRDPYILDFLGLNDRYLEKDLEEKMPRVLGARGALRRSWEGGRRRRKGWMRRSRRT